MPSYIVTAPDGRKYKVTGDGTEEQALSYVRANQGSLPELKPEGYGEPIQKDGQYQIGGPVRPETLGGPDIGKEYIAPVVEPAMTLATGIAGDIAGNVGGGIAMATEPLLARIQGRFQNPMIGPETRDRIAKMLTYQPRSEGAKRILTRWGDLLQPVGEVIESARLGDEALEAGLPEPIARTAEAIPEYAGAALAGIGLRQPKPKPPSLDKKGAIKSALVNKQTDVNSARYILSKKGEPIKYKLAEKAHSQGWNDDVIAIARDAAQNPATRKNALEMIHITKRAQKNPKWGAKNRPTQVVGQSLMDRYQYLQDLNRSIDIDGTAREFLAGKTVDHSAIFNKFSDSIAELGGVIDNGKLVFKPGSRLYGQPPNQKALRIIQDQIRALGPNPDAYRLHKLKQNIGDFVDFGKLPNSTTPVSGMAEGALKGLYREINQALKGVSGNYDSANTIFSETKQALRDIGDAFGKQLYGPNAEKATGTRMRRWIGNVATKDKIINAYEQADEIARRYGGEFLDDAETQIILANALDDILTTPTRRTTFKAEGAKQVQEALERSTLHKVATAADEGVRWFRGINDESALKSLEDLIRAGQ